MTKEDQSPNYDFQPTSPLEQVLNVSDIREYPGGVRAGVRALLLEKLPAGNFDDREMQHLLQAIKTDGFKSIPGSLFRKTHDVADLNPEQFLYDVSKQLEWQRSVIGWLLDELEGKHPPLSERNDA